MISFLHPGFFYAALAVAAALVTLHFIVTEQPRTGILPTVRFFPDLPARATTLTVRFSDALLLAMRVSTVLLVGAAFAQPQLRPDRKDVAQILVIDVSRATASAAEAADSALPYIGRAAAVVLFDSTAREVPVDQALDSVRSAAQGGSRPAGSLSPALIAALRAASRERERGDSMEIVVVSPFTAVSADAATMAIRSRWPGHIRLVQVRRDSTRPTAAKIARVEWADSARGTTWTRRNRIDTVGAIVAGSNNVMIFPFERRWKLSQAQSGGSTVIARWVDGEPAAIERDCVRSYGFALPTVGDAMLRPEFTRFSEGQREPCGAHASTGGTLPAAMLASFEGPRALAASSDIPARTTRVTPMVPWLLAAALLLALAELLVRRQQRANERANEKANEKANERAEETARKSAA